MKWMILGMMKKQVTKNSLIPKLISLLLPAAVLLLSGACSLRYYYPAPGITSENRYAIVRTDSLQVVLRQQNYQGSYQELNNRFFPLFIRMRNLSGQKQKIEPSGFSILAEGKQYDPVPLEYILLNLQHSVIINSYSDPFDPTDATDILQNNKKEQELYYDVLANSFGFGDLLAGALKEGYLFYNRDIAAADSFSIDVMGKSVGFVKK